MIRAKKEAYRTAYRFLSAAGRMEQEREEMLRSLYLAEKADAAAKRMIASMRNLRRGPERKRYISSVCGDGVYRLDTLSRQAKKVYAVTDKHGLGYLFMNTLYARLSLEGASCTVCPSPLVRTETEAIFLEGEDILFMISGEDEAARADKTVNSARFVDKEGYARRRQRLRFAEKCRDAVLEGAFSCFADAAALHAKTERIYGDCLDFTVTDGIMDKIINEIFANNM